MIHYIVMLCHYTAEHYLLISITVTSLRNYSRKKKYGFARTTIFNFYFGSLSCSNNEMLLKDVETKLFSCNTGPRIQHLENLAANAQMTATCTKYKRKPDICGVHYQIKVEALDNDRPNASIRDRATVKKGDTWF